MLFVAEESTSHNEEKGLGLASLAISITTL
jgi:hypothetical protein